MIIYCPDCKHKWYVIGAYIGGVSDNQDDRSSIIVVCKLCDLEGYVEDCTDLEYEKAFNDGPDCHYRWKDTTRIIEGAKGVWF